MEMLVTVVNSGMALSTSKVATTLSLAIKPLTKAVTICHSPKPMGRKTGAIQPATVANMLPSPLSTILKWKSKVCRNHITKEAKKITVKARCRKSLVLSQSRCATFLRPGIR